MLYTLILFVVFQFFMTLAFHRAKTWKMRYDLLKILVKKESKEKDWINFEEIEKTTLFKGLKDLDNYRDRKKYLFEVLCVDFFRADKNAEKKLEDAIENSILNQKLKNMF